MQKKCSILLRNVFTPFCLSICFCLLFSLLSFVYLLYLEFAFTVYIYSLFMYFQALFSILIYLSITHFVQRLCKFFTLYTTVVPIFQNVCYGCAHFIQCVMNVPIFQTVCNGFAKFLKMCAKIVPIFYHVINICDNFSYYVIQGQHLQSFFLTV